MDLSPEEEKVFNYDPILFKHIKEYVPLMHCSPNDKHFEPAKTNWSLVSQEVESLSQDEKAREILMNINTGNVGSVINYLDDKTWDDFLLSYPVLTWLLMKTAPKETIMPLLISRGKYINELPNKKEWIWAIRDIKTAKEFHEMSDSFILDEWDESLKKVVLSHIGFFYYILTYEDLPLELLNDLLRENVQRCDMGAVEALLRDGRVDPSINNNQILYAVLGPLEKGDSDIMMRLEINRRYQTERAKIIKLLLKDRRINPTLHNSAVLTFYSFMGYDEIVNVFLEDGRADPTTNNNESLLVAVREGHDEVVRVLLEDGRVNPTINNNEILFLAVRGGHDKVVKVLLEDGRIDPTVNNNEAYREATRERNVAMTYCLLQDERVFSTVQHPFKKI